MRGWRHVGRKSLIPGALILSLIVVSLLTIIPAEAAPRAASAAVIEQSKEILSDRSIDGPALWTSDPKTPNLGLASVLAWNGTDTKHSLNIMRSSDGVTYGGKFTFNEGSNNRPAVAVQGPPTTIVLAWIGTNSSNSLNLLCQGPACGVSGSAYKKLTLSDSSATSPALARFGSGFLLAWTGTDPGHSLNILPFSLTTSGSGFQLGAKTLLSQFSSATAPSLTLNPQNNQLLLSWAAITPATSPTDQLSFATSSDGVTWSQAQTLSETSAAGPAGFAVADTSMPAYWMAWTGTDAARSLNVRFTPSLSQWPQSDKTVLSDSAFGGPALGYAGDIGKTLLAWTGTDAGHHLNIATLTSPATPTLDQRIDAYISHLSTTQLIGQTLMMSVCANSYNSAINQALTVWDVGNVIIYTSCNGGPTEPPTAAGLQQLDAAIQSHATPAAGSLLLGIDEEGGTVDRLAPYYGSTPSAQQLAQTGNPQNAYNQAQTDASHMRSLGLNVDFAPVADVYQGGGEGPSRMFGTTVNAVTTYAGPFLGGLQQHGVAGTLKHWPGLGAATGNPDNTLPTINQTQAQMRAVDFPPFSNQFYQRPGLIMVTTVLAPAFDAQRPADLSPVLVNQVLRGQLGYQGVVVTDALGAQGILIYMRGQGYSNSTAAIAEASVRAFLAGNDILLCPLSQSVLQAVVSAMTKAVQSGRISATQLHTAVHRIIRLKVELGLISLP
jgi:beta-N-acetylhexosaminidase